MSTRATAAIETAAALPGFALTARVPIGSDIYNRLLETLYEEAAALDERRYEDWVAMLATDIVYTAPIRLTRTGAERNRDVVRTMYHFNETYGSIAMRTRRLGRSSAWAEDPPSRARRFITNLRVAETEVAGEYRAVTNLLLVRSRGDLPETETFTGERHDIWRIDPSGAKLAYREIIPDQSTLAMMNLSIFL
jgi:3-phenylpropionate/cinnamic acid dioxygenase small subunit